ncbi:MAG TPA: hypothetical protein VFX06_14625 [Stellaceae bacterium]|nr:hypothetical protein [Stellaceae bacterium]
MVWDKAAALGWLPTEWDKAAALWWLPTALVAAMAALAFVAVVVRPGRGRLRWMALVLVLGPLAIAVSAWRQQDSRTRYGAETARLRALGARLDALGRMLPGGPGRSEADTFDTAAAQFRALNGKVKDLEGQIDALRQKADDRRIAPEKAAALADFLRRSGNHRVVVSVAPDDVEAHAYANQIANVLRAAGWNALGPEATTIFGEAAAMGIRIYVRDGKSPPDGAAIIQDAFTRFNIPFAPGVAPSAALPDAATTELFISHKP